MINKGWHRAKIIWFLTLLILLLQGRLSAQNYSNHWINPNQTYYRFSIPETGIYRITAQELQQAGISGSFNPQNIQLFYNGQEIPCYIKGENLGLTEYIEFYAEKNSGWFDVEMHDNPQNQANPYYSLITDTAAVFLTWNNSFSNKRYTVETDVNYTGYTPETYAYYHSLVQYTNGFHHSWPGSRYLEGEGYADASYLALGASIVRKVATPNFVANGEPTTVSWSMLSKSVYGHHLQVTGPGIAFDTIYYQYKTVKGFHKITGQELPNETILTFSSVNDLSAPTDFSALSYIRISYPRSFHVEGLNTYPFTLPATGTKKAYLEFTGLDASASYVLYDISRGIKIPVRVENSLLKALVPASSASVELLLTKENSILKITNISQSKMLNHANINKERLVISHPKLWNAAQTYAAYREAYLVNVEELYNQFGYGIRKHPMAIRNFLKYVFETWETQPSGLFIIGDGIAALNFRKNTTYYQQCLIPPMGNPASDELFGSRFDGSTVASVIPVSRLAATTETEVLDYLDKVKAMEQNVPGAWMKQICHFGGGSNSIEQTRFKNFLKSYEQTIIDTSFGGFVSTFLKNSSDPITISRTDSITNLINNGVSLMTFFGHGTSTGFDQNIDEPIVYNNQNRYPLLFANSCYSGNIFLAGLQSASDRWVLIPNKGAIGFLAMVNDGVDSYLNLFATEFYKQLTYKSYGSDLGTLINRSKKAIQTTSNPGYYLSSTIEEFTLHGDLWVILNSFEKPDLSIDSKDVFFTPATLTTEIDSFFMHVAPTNLAKATSQTFLVEVTRWFQDGTYEVYQKMTGGLNFKDTLTFKLPVDFVKGPGNNRFLISVDVMNQVEEMNEANNTLTINKFISSSDLQPVIPYKFSVWPESSPLLKVSTGNAFGTDQTSIFQIDTSYRFDSPELFQEELTHSGGVLSWQPAVSLNQNQPYYWRAAKKTATGNEIWSGSSFVPQNGKSGWHQRAIGQMLQNSYKFIEVDEPNRQFTFSALPKTLTCYNIGSPGSGDFANIKYTIDGNGDFGSCGATAALLVAIIDSTNLVPWQSDRANYGHQNYEKCFSRTRPDNYFVFHLRDTLIPASMDHVVNLIESQVPDGFYFLIYSFIAANYQYWQERHFAAFQAWGGTNNLRFAENYQPLIFFSQKGKPALTEELIGQLGETIDLQVPLKMNNYYGSITSPLIGPAKQWSSLSWESVMQESNLTETAFVRVYTEDGLGNQVLLMDSISENSKSLSSINAATHPYLRLQFFTSDPEYKTPSQLRFWQVEYTPFTDLAINTQRDWLFESDTLNEGALGKLVISFENIGNQDADSVKVNYWAQDANNRQITLDQKELGALKAGAWVSDTLIFETKGMVGNNQLWIELNPRNNSKSSAFQNEPYYFNNLAQKSFYVKADQTSPMLDVTFDGIHIMDGDLVSAKPEIVIQLTDENPYIALDDTTLVSVYIKSHKTGIEEKIDLKNNPEITFIPADLPNNKAQIIYRTQFPDDGVYELRVQAADASGNESGSHDYLISFSVINESTITQVFNYPNPFSTSTRFVFELTGSEIPDEMRIDILTITGKVVKVIYQEDLGLIGLGKNISTYAWDGTDMYGDPLANGVYFYRVSAKLNGREIKIRDTGTSHYFTKGFGKMYLMR
ncbi:MAG: C25 family cysteine peptidase [Salinivirgaceae bacterium]